MHVEIEVVYLAKANYTLVVTLIQMGKVIKKNYKHKILHYGEYSTEYYH